MLCEDYKTSDVSSANGKIESKDTKYLLGQFNTTDQPSSRRNSNERRTVNSVKQFQRQDLHKSQQS